MLQCYMFNNILIELIIFYLTVIRHYYFTKLNDYSRDHYYCLCQDRIQGCGRSRTHIRYIIFLVNIYLNLRRNLLQNNERTYFTEALHKLNFGRSL